MQFAEPTEEAAVPVVQFVQEEWPVYMTVLLPTGQLVHVVAPDLAAYLPAGQSSHESEVLRLVRAIDEDVVYLPELQVVQVPEPERQ